MLVCMFVCIHVYILVAVKPYILGMAASVHICTHAIHTHNCTYQYIHSIYSHTHACIVNAVHAEEEEAAPRAGVRWTPDGYVLLRTADADAAKKAPTQVRGDVCVCIYIYIYIHV